MSVPAILSDRDHRDIQGLVLFGTTCPHLRYHFLQIGDPVQGRRFVHTFLDAGDPLHINTAGLRDERTRSTSLVYVAFTWPGLRALGLPEVSLSSFPEEFRQGPRPRAEALGDVDASAPERWLFDPDAVHMAVLIYARDEQTLERLSTGLRDRAARFGCPVVTTLDARALPDDVHQSGQLLRRPVHFGYSSGISEPEMLPALNRRSGTPPAVPPGMFVLGHASASDEEQGFAVANQPLPIPATLSHNGTFGAFRMLRQDVDAYEDFLDRHAVDPAARELLAAKMCGRWRNGVPLALSPTTPHPNPPLAPGQYNEFDYRPTAATPNAASDDEGRSCPAGAHIRRSNPRSAEILGGMGHRIRLIRRGMPYGPAYNPSRKRDGVERGLMGLFLCASLADQFEFVLRRWINDGLFARGLAPDERDPIVGAQGSAGTFSYREGNGTQTTISGLARFVTTRAAAYLFFPSVTGLRYLSRLPDQMQTDREREAVDEDIEVIVQAMLHAIGTGTTRDAHPRHHGLVKALVEIADDIPYALRHGLFATPRTYTAYIRFSNGRPGPVPPADAEPDVRGMALKLFGVEGEKEMADEKLTHDFVLASHPAFFVPDVHAYVDFLRLDTLADKMRMFPELPKSFRSFENPLTIRYFSQTPYALGPHVVKYVVQPIDPAEQPPMTFTPEQIAARTPNYLREAMAASLSNGSATLTLGVQLPPHAAAASLDDATRRWETPVTKVATIRIPAQDFRTPAQDALAETISMSPWHCLHEHRPLGSVNLARRRVYREASVLRHANRGVLVKEPNGVDDF
jgi:deferrochelatase/peroxidase EfeB